jgi:hypothetical protein
MEVTMKNAVFWDVASKMEAARSSETSVYNKPKSQKTAFFKN